MTFYRCAPRDFFLNFCEFLPHPPALPRLIPQQIRRTIENMKERHDERVEAERARGRTMVNVHRVELARIAEGCDSRPLCARTRNVTIAHVAPRRTRRYQHEYARVVRQASILQNSAVRAQQHLRRLVRLKFTEALNTKVRTNAGSKAHSHILREDPTCAISFAGGWGHCAIRRESDGGNGGYSADGSL